MKRLSAFAPLAALLLIAVVSAFLLLRGGERQTISDGRIGRAAPAYELPDLWNGPHQTNAAHAGRSYLINVFASWCTPCRAEHPQLLALQQRGVEVLGVAYKDDPSDSAAFLRELGNPYAAVGVDREGRFGLDLGIAGVPETFVIGADGTIKAVHRGPLTQEVINTIILPALNAG